MLQFAGPSLYITIPKPFSRNAAEFPRVLQKMKLDAASRQNAPQAHFSLADFWGPNLNDHVQ